MLKADAQTGARDGLRSVVRFVLGLLAALAVVDSIGAGALIAPALLPLLFWAVVTARSRPSRVILALLTGMCFAVGAMVLFFAVGFRSDAASWIGLAMGACVVVILLRWAPRRRRA